MIWVKLNRVGIMYGRETGNLTGICISIAGIEIDKTGCDRPP